MSSRSLVPCIFRTRPGLRILAASALLSGGSGCVDLPTADSGQVPVELAFAALPELLVGDTVELRVTATDPAGNVLADPPIGWSSLRFSDQPPTYLPPVIVGQDNGWIRFHLSEAGLFGVTASIDGAHPVFGGASDSIQGRILHRLSSLEIVGLGPDTLITYALPGSLEFTVEARDHRNRLRDPRGHLSVDRRGDGVIQYADYYYSLVIGLNGEGSDTLFLEFQDCEGSCADTLVVTVDLQPAYIGMAPHFARSLGDTVQLTAAVYDSGGTEIVGAPVRWSLSAPGDSAVLELIDAESGLAIARANGIVGALVESEGVTGSGDVTVEQRADSVAIELSRDTLYGLNGADTILAAVALVGDARGNPIPHSWIQGHDWWGTSNLDVIPTGSEAAVLAEEYYGAGEVWVTVVACGPLLPCSNASGKRVVFINPPP